MSGPGRHPLLDEAKSELDIVFEAVREAERLMAVPAMRGGGAADLYELYEMQADAVERFRLVSVLFAAASAADFPEEAAIRFAEIQPGFAPVAIECAAEIADFSRAFEAYQRGTAVAQQDDLVRRSTAAIEGAVRRLPQGASPQATIAPALHAE